MAVTWYYTREGKETGPVTAQELRELAKTGQLTPTDLVWKEGMPEWVEASRITNLFDASLLQYSPSAAAPSPARAAEEPLPSPRTDSPGPTRGRQGGAAARRDFGPAESETVDVVLASLQQLIARPLRSAYVTFLFAAAAVAALSGVITVVFFPALVMGYVTVMKQVSEGEAISLNGFIDFMRQGWNSLMHMLMTLAAFIVTAAAMIAPGVIAYLALYVVFGTAGAVVNQISASFSSSPPPSDTFVIFSLTADGAFSWLPRLAAKVTPKFGSSVEYAVFVLRLLPVAAPVVAALILNCLLALDVANSQAEASRPFDLVYEAFGRMWAVAGARWKQLLVTSVLVPAAWAIGFACIALTFEMSWSLKLHHVSNWILWILGLMYMVAFFVYTNILITRTAVAFYKQQAKGT